MEKMNAQVAGENPDEAAKTAERVQRDPGASQIDRAVADAVRLQQQGEIEAAIEKWRSIANVVGEEDRQLQTRAWFSIGYLSSVGEGIDLEAAIDAYNKAIELNPTLAGSYNNRGSAKDNLGRSEEAIADYDRAIELDPDYAEAYYNRGNAKNNLDRPEEAIADYDRAIELNPDYAGYYYNRGNAKNNLGRPEEAIADYDRAIELNPDHAGYYYNRGNVKRALSRIDEARADFQKGLDLAQSADNEEFAEAVKRALSYLDNDEGS